MAQATAPIRTIRHGPSAASPWDYELTLRSRQPDGKQATSKQSVVVALDAVESTGGRRAIVVVLPDMGLSPIRIARGHDCARKQGVR